MYPKTVYVKKTPASSSRTQIMNIRIENKELNMQNNISSPEQEILNVFAGKWTIDGKTSPKSNEPALKFTGTTEYTWLPGGFFLKHELDAYFGNDKVDALEMIGPFDPQSKSYPMRSFDNQGNYTTMEARVDEDGIWTLSGETQRAVMTPAYDKSAIDISWEKRDGDTWAKWMEVKFIRAEDRL